MLLVQLHLLLFLCSPSFAQTPPGGNMTFGEDVDVESMDEETSGEEVEEEEDIVESVNEVVQKQEDGTDPMKEFEASQKALSDAWKELGDAEVAAEEVKQRLTKWQERWLMLTNLLEIYQIHQVQPTTQRVCVLDDGQLALLRREDQQHRHHPAVETFKVYIALKSLFPARVLGRLQRTLPKRRQN